VGATVVAPKSVELARYHLSAALLANGVVALSHLSERLLAEAGIPGKSRLRFVSTLLASVQRNVDSLGTTRALTGPVRRGDDETLARHLGLLAGSKGATLPLYRALVLTQLEMVAGLGELTAREQRRIRALVETP
jgi:predicted short-subunit dehydrogenase-like oxidoreductase (DUF2520 family)